MSTTNPAPNRLPADTFKDPRVKEYFRKQQETVRILTQSLEEAKRYALMVS